ncbi:MAG TPA: Npt1/Npt2 family nucleotide transporter, partial [Calditrichia bacterium]|nr:Npt1/Npt2 family nucleotide transporter [Calditrichia bacterium]
GKRLFAIVGFGASAGAVVGATSVKPIIAPLGIFWPMLAGGAVLVLSLMITNWVDSRESRRPHAEAEKEAIEEPPMSNISPYKLVFQNRYLLLIAVLILLLNWVNTSGEYILGRILKETASAAALSQGLAGDLQQEFVKRWIGEFYADFFGIVNALGLVMQLFLVSRILKYLGVRLALMILPIIALGGYSLTALFPVLGIVRWSKTGENATDYSLMNTLRGVVFLPTTREEKYKAKQAIDTIFVRLGDVLSALTVFLGTTVFVFSVAQFAWVNLVLVVFWLLVAIAIGRRYQALVAEKEQIPAQQEA